MDVIPANPRLQKANIEDENPCCEGNSAQYIDGGNEHEAEVAVGVEARILGEHLVELEPATVECDDG